MLSFPAKFGLELPAESHFHGGARIRKCWGNFIFPLQPPSHLGESIWVSGEGHTRKPGVYQGNSLTVSRRSDTFSVESADPYTEAHLCLHRRQLGTRREANPGHSTIASS